MTIAITWTITNLDRKTADGFITTAHWTALAVDGDFSASIYSTVGFPEGTPTVAYQQVTQETVLGWIWENGVDKDTVEAALTAQIEAQKAPVSASGLPWVA